MQMYDDLAYARTRLRETVVMHKGIPVIVDNIEGKWAYIRKLGDMMIGDEVNAKELDITPVKLGYLNEDSRALYITRTPMREDWRQGLRSLSIRVVGDERQYDPAPKALHDVIMGIYPKLSECFRYIKRDVQSMAFSRNFAVKKDGILAYKGKWDVGTITAEKEYSLVPKFDWVRETLDEELVAA